MVRTGPPGVGASRKVLGLCLARRHGDIEGWAYLVEKRIYRGEPIDTTSSGPSILTGRRTASSPVNHYPDGDIFSPGKDLQRVEAHKPNKDVIPRQRSTWARIHGSPGKNLMRKYAFLHRVKNNLPSRMIDLLQGTAALGRLRTARFREAATIECIEGIVRSLKTVPLKRYLTDSLPSTDEWHDFSCTHCVVEINDTCNLDCAMCKTSQSKRKKGTMDPALFEAIVQKLKKAGMNIASLHTIGDPLANRRLGDYLEIVRKYGLKISVLSSNFLLLEKWMDAVFEYRDIIQSIRPSIDAAGKEVYERIRCGGNWEILLENLGTFARGNERLARPFPVFVNNIISQDNFHELAFIPQVFAFLAPPHHFTFSFINSLSPKNEYFLSKSYFGGNREDNIPCSELWRGTTILKDGSMTTCCRDYDGELAFGNAVDDDFQENHNSPFVRKLRRAALDGDIKSMPPCCRTCYIVDPRLSDMLNAVFNFFFFRVRKHPVYLQNALNKMGPMMKRQDFDGVIRLLKGLS